MSNYPHRPSRRSAPVSSHSGGRKSKSWSSLREKVEGNRDIGARLNAPWWKSPLMKADRLAMAATRR